MSSPQVLGPPLNQSGFLREVTYDVDEFKKLVTDSRLRYDIRLRGDGSGIRYSVILRVYGIAKEGHVIVLEVKENVDTLKTMEPIEESIRKTVNKLTKLAEELGARPGRYELW